MCVCVCVCVHINAIIINLCVCTALRRGVMTPVMPLGGTAGPVKKKASTGYDVYIYMGC